MNIRTNPWLLGLAIALIAFPIAFLIVVDNPSLEAFLDRDKTWVGLGYYTIVLFGLLVWWYWSRRASGTFWVVIVSLCLMHLSGFVSYISHFGALSPLRYSIIGPFEAMILGLCLERSIFFLNRGHPHKRM